MNSNSDQKNLLIVDNENSSTAALKKKIVKEFS
jgi:hypothetical protein